MTSTKILLELGVLLHEMWTTGETVAVKVIIPIQAHSGVNHKTYLIIRYSTHITFSYALYSVSKNAPAKSLTIRLSGNDPATPYNALFVPSAMPFLPNPLATLALCFSFSSATTIFRSATSSSTAFTMGSVTATCIPGGFCRLFRCHPRFDIASATS